MNSHSYIIYYLPGKEKKEAGISKKQTSCLSFSPVNKEMGGGVGSRCSAGHLGLPQATRPAASPGRYLVPHFLYLAVALKAGI
jgi:hypothetical protein